MFGKWVLKPRIAKRQTKPKSRGKRNKQSKNIDAEQTVKYDKQRGSEQDTSQRLITGGGKRTGGGGVMQNYFTLWTLMAVDEQCS